MKELFLNEYFKLCRKYKMHISGDEGGGCFIYDWDLDGDSKFFEEIVVSQLIRDARE